MSGPEKFPEALLDQYLTGTISEADRKVLEDWFGSFSDEEVAVLSERSKEAVQEAIWDSIEKRTGIEKNVLKKVDTAKIVPGRFYLYRYGRIAAACLLLVALGWGALSYFGRAHKDVPDKVARQSDERRTDHNGAILTLSNGKRVSLDSTGTGQIAVQGNARILQQGGQISYLNTGGQSGQATALNTMTTPRGKQFALVLPDGTKVWLNAASSITYPVQFAKDRRNVSITGEVYFEVAHITAPDHKTRVPFDVRSGQLHIEVLGTHFNIQNYPEEQQVKTTLLEGSVAVHYGKDGPKKTIRPGQQATIDKADPGSISLDEVDTQQVVAWKSGLFFFKDEPLSDILKQVARWYDVDAGADPAKMKLRFSGVISKRARLEDLLDVLSATGVVQFKISENKVYGY